MLCKLNGTQINADYSHKTLTIGCSRRAQLIPRCTRRRACGPLAHGHLPVVYGAESTEPIPIPLEGAEGAVRRAVDQMLRLNVIEEIKGGYQFEVPLVKRWVADHGVPGVTGQKTTLRRGWLAEWP